MASAPAAGAAARAGAAFAGRRPLLAAAARRPERAGPPRAAAGAAAEGPRKIQLAYNPEKTAKELQSQLQASQSVPGRLTLFSPSKINVFLRVTARRPDGYHDLASLFHVIDLGDTLKFSESPSETRDSLTANISDVPLDDSNLILKAFKLFRAKTGIQKHFWVHLDKQVPMGAGLGGGSGNGATALWAANILCGSPASEAQLLAWSAELGSDCPFFFSHGAAYCTGRGEVVEDLVPSPLPADTRLLLVKPNVGLATSTIFKSLDLASRSQAEPRELLRRVVAEGFSDEVCVNDLEPPAFAHLPELKQLKQRLRAAGNRGHFKAVFMSGSGSTIVGLGSHDAPAFLYEEEQYAGLFIAPARFITREAGKWFTKEGPTVAE